jgi:hypothetical protein
MCNVCKRLYIFLRGTDTRLKGTSWNPPRAAASQIQGLRESDDRHSDTRVKIHEIPKKEKWLSGLNGSDAKKMALNESRCLLPLRNES